MNKQETRKMLKCIEKVNSMTANELYTKGFMEDDIYTCPYIDLISAPHNIDGIIVHQETDIFTVNDSGIDFLEEYAYRDKPLTLSKIAIGISFLALLKSFVPEFICILQWLLQGKR